MKSKPSLEDYTSNGFRLKNLKIRAKTIAKERNLSHRQSLDYVAKKAGFTCWNNLINEDVEPERKEFFRYAFKEKGAFQELFETYCSARSVQKSHDTYREFVVHQFELHQKGRREEKRNYSCHKTIVIDGFIKEWSARLEMFGTEALLPQNIPDYLLFPALGHLRNLFGSSVFSVNEPIEVGSDEAYGLRVIMDSVVRLIQHNRGDKTEAVDISNDEISDALECYYLHLMLESAKRTYQLKIESLTLNNILDRNATLKANLPQEMFEDLISRLSK